jgi:Na+-transporting methylmalonyl-CoA/oxaloacetate decarboxylase gamma subunit
MLMTWSDVWAVVLTGLIVVFAGLLLLIFFVWLFGKIVVGIQNAKKPPQGGQTGGNAPDEKSAPSNTASKTGGISGDVIAAISAAVTAFAGEGAVITSIKRAQPKMRAKSLEWKQIPFGGAEIIESGRWQR